MLGEKLFGAARRALGASAAALCAWSMAGAPAIAQDDGASGGDPYYQYGRYCGGGVPVQSAGHGQTDARLAVLESWWAPADDLDAYCFSHDYCFEMLGSDSLICDQAMEQVLGSYVQRAGPACGAIASNMYKAFVYKPWSKGGMGRLSGLARAANRAGDLGGNDLRDMMLNSAVANVSGAAEAGTCNFAGAPNPQIAVSEFVNAVRYSGGVSAFTICTPDMRATGACVHPSPADLAGAGQAAQSASDLEEIGKAAGALKGLFNR
ncbi:MAG: hypothetical protein MI723_09405 [Caulobacterales bacterium]|nr:hypothetical protein [Caulobacterales bacterium]